MNGRSSALAPARILARLRSICGRLPEVREEAAWAGTRWVVRTRNFAHVLRIVDGWPPVYARAAGSDGPLVVLTFRASTVLHDALREQGPPFFHAAWGTRWGTKVVGMALGTGVDWKQVASLVSESYRLLAPRALAAAVPPLSLGAR